MSIAYDIAYDDDFFAWTKDQANHLRMGNIGQLDITHLIEEIESMGISQKHALRSRMAVLIMHLLKWQFQPNLQSKSWLQTIIEQRDSISDILEDSPSLKTLLQDEEWQQKVWSSAVKKAVVATGLAKNVLPAKPIWIAAQVLDEDFYPSESQA